MFCVSLALEFSYLEKDLQGLCKVVVKGMGGRQIAWSQPLGAPQLGACGQVI